MIKKLCAQLAVVGVASLALLGLGAVASLLQFQPHSFEHGRILLQRR